MSIIELLIDADEDLDVAMMLMPASFYSSSIVQLSWISGSLSQPAVKRAASIALINCICNTPNSEFNLVSLGLVEEPC